MTRRQCRWYCPACRREWVFSRHGPEGNCPACGGPDIARVEFEGLFDIHTPQEAMVGLPEMPAPARRESDILAPPIALVTEDLWRP